MKKLTILALSFLTLASLASDFPKGSPAFLSSSESALKQAAESGKPIIMVFSAAWCPPCQSMKNEVYPSREIKAYHDKFVWVYLDVDQSGNEAAAKKFGVSSIPHIQFLGSDGKAVSKQVGGSSSDQFAKTLAGVLKKVK
jgi:thioredoxin-related protein